MLCSNSLIENTIVLKRPYTKLRCSLGIPDLSANLGHAVLFIELVHLSNIIEVLVLLAVKSTLTLIFVV